MSVGIFNLTTGNSDSWGSVYTANPKAYGVSLQIYAVVGGSAAGNASKLKPDAGWNNTSVASLFTGTTNLTANARTEGYTSPTPAPTLTTTATPKPKPKSLSGGAIVGIVIGIVVVIFAAIILALFLRERTRQREKKETEENQRNEAFTKPELQTTASETLNAKAAAVNHER